MIGRSAALLGAVMLIGASPANANDARIVEERQIEPRVIELTIATPAFGAPTKVDVVLPVGYDADTARRWPVTYFLAGTMNTYRTFKSVLEGVKLAESFASIVVSPNGDSGYWSDWYNGGAFGPPMYETYVIDQLIALIDARFRTLARRSQRAVLGTSMGGYGAMMVAARHPDRFVAAASLSGAVDSNLPVHGAVLSLSPTFQGAQADAIYGPRATQEIRWRGHNPTDLADNLGGVDVQVRSANGVPNLAIGESLLSADSASCVVEAGVYMASVSLHETLHRLRIPHLWQDYGAGCHTRPNFQRQITDTFRAFTRIFADPPAPPPAFDYRTIEPVFDVWDWHVETDATRPLEFLQLRKAGAGGVTLVGSGTTTVATPPLFRGLRRVDVTGATPAAPDRAGRVRFTVDLSAGTPRTIAFAPHAIVKVAAVRRTRRGVRVCARAVGGEVSARLRVVTRDGSPLTRTTRVVLTARATCRVLRRRRAATSIRGTLRITGRDAFGHAVHRTARV